MFLAEVATAADVQALGSQVQTLFRVVAFVVILAVGYYSLDTVKKWFVTAWQRLKSELTSNATDPETPAPRVQRLASTAKPARGFDTAAQTLLQSIAADPSVTSTVMTVEKSDGTYKLEFTTKGAVANG